MLSFHQFQHLLPLPALECMFIPFIFDLLYTSMVVLLLSTTDQSKCGMQNPLCSATPRSFPLSHPLPTPAQLSGHLPIAHISLKRMVGPTVSLSTLSRADGSASYKCPTTGYDLLGSVHAPIELPARRDALKPEEATVEVFVKPGNTTAGVGERYVEGILRSVLTKVVLGRERGFPRRGVVITLAIVGGETVTRGDSVSFFFFFFFPYLCHPLL